MVSSICEHQQATLKPYPSSNPNSLLNPTSEKTFSVKKSSSQASGMDKSRDVFIAGSQRMNNKAKENTMRKEVISRRQIVQDEEDVNDLAEAFIKNFRSQLKMQREESLKRFHEMIGRGV